MLGTAKKNVKSFKNFKAKPKQVSGTSLVRERLLNQDHYLPLIIEPNTESMDLGAWIVENLSYVTNKLYKHGGLLFRGFNLKSDTDFSNLIKKMPYELMPYFEGSTPRKEVSSMVFTSTLFPNEERILLHNEYSSSMRFPLKVWFYSSRAPEPGCGGQTPISCARNTYKRIDKDVRDEFEAKGWCLIRNYGDNLGLPWRRAFAIQDKDELAEYAAKNLIDLHWKGDDRLRTRQVRSAVLAHPVTGEKVWFNHMAFWHAANLRAEVREEMVAQHGYEGLPYHTYFGDGTPIPDDVARHIRDAYLAEKIMFPWQTGDLMLADNLLISHGREPFTGPREIRVAMAEPYHRPFFPQPPLSPSAVC